MSSACSATASRWKLFHLSAEPDLYAPVLEFAAGEDAFPTVTSFWNGITKETPNESHWEPDRCKTRDPFQPRPPPRARPVEVCPASWAQELPRPGARGRQAIAGLSAPEHPFPARQCPACPESSPNLPPRSPFSPSFPLLSRTEMLISPDIVQGADVGWFRLDTAFASRSKRCRDSGLADSVGGRTLTAPCGPGGCPEPCRPLPSRLRRAGTGFHRGRASCRSRVPSLAPSKQ